MDDLTQLPLVRSPADPLRPLPLPRVTKLIGKAMDLAYRLTGKHRYDDFRLERVLGVPLLVTPSVFNPKLPRTGAFLAAQIDSQLVSGGAEVLDIPNRDHMRAVGDKVYKTGVLEFLSRRG